MPKPLQKIMQYIGEHGMVRPRDIEAIGLPREYLIRLHRQGKLNRPARGIYTFPDADVTEHHSYAEITKRVPQATVCLLSALVFHEITTQNPASVWIALSKGARAPALFSPSLRIVRFQGHHSQRESTGTRWKASQSVSIQPRRPSPTVLSSGTRSDSMLQLKH